MPTVISQEVNPCLFTNKHPLPSIKPANHSQNDVEKGAARKVSEVPTKLEICRWLPADRSTNFTFLPRRDVVNIPPLISKVVKFDSRFQHTALCVSNIKLDKGHH